MKMLHKALLTSALALTTGSAALAEVNLRQFEGTELNLVYQNQGFIAALREIAPEFETLTGIKVNVETLSEAAAIQKMQLELATGSSAYDIVGVQSGNLPLYADNNWILPVESFFGNASISDPAQLGINDFIPSTLDGMASGGTQYCLPYFAATVILYYQIDKFRDAGITEAPKTFAEFVEAASKVHTSEVPAIAMRGSPAAAAGNIWPFNLFFYGEGAEYFVDFPNDLTPTVNSPEAVKALETWVEIKQNYSPEGAVNFVFDDVVTGMQQGNVVMVIDGAPLAGRILDPEQSKVSGNLGFAVVPGGPAGPNPSFASHGLCVAGGSKNAEAAYMFLEYALSAEQMVNISQFSNYLATPRNSVWEDASFVEKYNFDFGGGAFLEVYQESLAVAPADYYPPFPGWQLVGERIGQAVQEAEIGQKSPKDALDDANADILDILTEEGYIDG
jgi:ABC-type glycerol-3-phosphate transport system substrate-binding protein